MLPAVRKFIAAGAVLTVALPAIAQEVLSGPAVATDGQTIAFERVHVRLYGVAAPDAEQLCVDAHQAVYDCGSVATGELRRLTAGRKVTCRRRGLDRQNEIVALCFVGDLDLGREMVRRGWAVVDGDRSHSYDAAQREAKAARRGMWAGSFELPSRWREEHPGAHRAPAAGN
jgi:endonuclease YncB( thermonuclease family)